ncbi:sigma factor-like helix-turn-helix DNA-binding protein [Lentzea sp. NPDC042327]|uniref:sigma factor-like helix-turn-helix DNA-binding protein n=1 Tax=Lentzea sp. NPDC042327 TaxID=3154801 RepID=UPI003402F086
MWPGLRHLAALTEDQREVLRLRVVRGLSAEQTAHVLGSTPAAVRLVQHQALETLRAVIRLS